MADPHLTERQVKWFASVREGLVRETGRSLDDWIAIARSCPETKLQAQKIWLKENHGLGGNRAAVLLDDAFPDTAGWDDPKALLAQLWKDAGLREVYDRIEAVAMALEATVAGARKSFSAFSRNFQFAAARPYKGALRLGLAVPPGSDPRLEPAKPNEGWSDRLKSSATLTLPSDVDARVTSLITSAWAGS